MVERRSGLPVGMPLSPLLSNLLLDSFDRMLEGHGFKLVRFADDFLVLCRDRASAEAALDEAKASLASLHLTVHEGKTHITSFEEGFAFLGYRFHADGHFTPIATSGEARAPHPARAGGASRHASAERPTGDRGAHVRRNAGHGPHTPHAPAEDATLPMAALEPLEPNAGGPIEGEPVPIHVLDAATRVHVEREALRIEPREGEVIHLPLRRVRHLVINRSAWMSLPCLAACAEHGIPVYVVRRNGALLASTLPAPTWPSVTSQVRFVEQVERRVAVARRMIAAKLHNAATLVTRFGWRDAAERSAVIRRIESSVERVEGLDELRGLEGAGAALWFEGLVAELPEEWGFRGRRKHPSPDPVNAMLSLGYTTLHHHAVTALAAAGAIPDAGVFHEPRSGHHALASDLVEEFRFLVDGIVWRALRQPECTPGDFHMEGEACLLGEGFLRAFLGRLEARLLSPAAGSGGSQTYRARFDEQARQLQQLFHGGREAYDAFRLHG